MNTAQRNNDSIIRAFIAVPINNSLNTRLADIQAELKTCDADIRWVAPDNIHMTLVFLGDTFESKADSINAELEKLLSGVSACVMEAKGVGFFGKPASPRIIWAGLHGDIGQMRLIQQKAFHAARNTGCMPDDKPFSPHFTLGRVKSKRNAKTLVEMIKKKKDACFGKIIVQNILFMKSDLTPDGPKYSVLHKIILENNGED